MQLSNYLKTFSDPEFPGQTILYSTKQTSLAMLPDEDFELLQRGKRLPEYEEALVELGMMVPDRETEREQLNNFFSELDRQNPNLAVSVILGMECNFDCQYCFEGTLKGKKSMTDATADRLIGFLKERMLLMGKKSLRLAFYGGEPLLYTSRIKYLAKPLQEFAKKHAVDFSFNIVTNGSLLKPSVVKELKECGFRYAKVTIDGLPMNHNQFRPFKNKQPSYDAIVGNLEKVCGMIDIGLGGNYTSYNYQQFPLLLDRLRCNGIKSEHLDRVLFSMVMKIQDEYAMPEFNGGCVSANEPWLVESTLYIREEVLKRGYYVPKIKPEICAMNVSDNFTVHFDGGFYKCLPLAGRKQFEIGNLETGMQDDNHIYQENWKKEEKCQECSYLPLCFGGCRFALFQRTGSLEGVECQKTYLDMTLKTMILQDLKYRENGINAN